MARASRGASRIWDAPHVVCPTTGAIELETGDGYPWTVTATWSPNVVAVTVAFDVRINGGDWQLIEIVGPAGSGANTALNPTDYGDPGDLVECRARVGDIPGCGDFVTTISGHAIDS